MINTKLIDHRVILLKNYYINKKDTEFRCDGFSYRPVNKNGYIFEIEFVQNRKDLFKEIK